MAEHSDIVSYSPALRAPAVAFWRSVFSFLPLYLPMDRARWQQRIERAPGFDPAHLRVAVAGEDVVGLAHGGIWDGEWKEALAPGRDGDRVGYLALVAVAPAWRRQGLGTALLSSLRQSLGEPGLLEVDGRMFNPFYGNFLGPRSPLWGTPEGAAVLAGDGTTRAALRAWGFDESTTATTRILQLDRWHDESGADPAGIEMAVTRDYQPDLGTDEGSSFLVPNDSWTWLAVEGESQRGALIAFPLENEGDWGIFSLEVEAAARGRGIGKRLLEVALRGICAEGGKRVHVLVLPEEAPEADRLYTQSGFEAVDSWVVFG